MKDIQNTQIYKGNIITSKTVNELALYEKSYIVVKDGIIEDIFEKLPKEYENADVTDYGENLIIPAFSDLHIHAPQYRERGVGMDCLLFDWLNRYTFPEEARFQEKSYAKAIYAQVVRDLIANGTAHASLFTTIHYEASDLIFRMLKESGMYAFAGKVNMDQNSPEFLVETPEQSVAETERFVAEHLGDDHVKPILTPRFAPTCSEELLKELGRIAQTYHVGLQTHLVESKAEAAWAAELFPQYGSDGAIYEGCGLLGEGPAIFAHVIFPTEVEERILKKYQAVSVHCPDATANITAGIMPVSQMLEKGLRLGSGSDVGGGHHMGVYTQISQAVQLSKLKEFYEPDYKRICFANGFYMATAEGGSLFGKAGKLEKGYRFDALVLDPMQDAGTSISLLESLERFCYIGGPENIKHRYIDGKLVDPEKVYEKLLEME
ncbi:MAG: amidohydrolase family protein [Eubacteriales bacterium]|nr:amidohydrolase family protein [Eubacteriales bacterium]